VAVAPSRVVPRFLPTEDERADGSERIGKALVVAVLFLLYAFGQPWDQRGLNRDVESTSIPAWHFVETGSWDLAPYRDIDGWFVETDRGLRSNRTPGLIAVAVLGYSLTSPFTTGFDEWPSTLVAAVTSWLAVLVVAATAERLKKGAWLPAIVLFGLGTATWGVSSMHLWPHGPAQLAIALAVWFMVRGKDLGAGLALAVAVLIRPPVILIALCLAALKAYQERSWGPLTRVGGPSVAAAFMYLAYMQTTFGSWSPLASYDAVGGLLGYEGLNGWLVNLFASFVGLPNGVLVWSAWIVAALVTWRSTRALVPMWLFLTPIVAAAYVVLHGSLEIASGALPYDYRYQLEAVTVAAPILVVSFPILSRQRRTQLIVALSIAASVFLQAAVVFVSRCWFETAERVCSLLG
jgi:hypothetical protein